MSCCCHFDLGSDIDVDHKNIFVEKQHAASVGGLWTEDAAAETGTQTSVHGELDQATAIYCCQPFQVLYKSP